MCPMACFDIGRNPQSPLPASRVEVEPLADEGPGPDLTQSGGQVIQHGRCTGWGERL